MLAPRKTLWSTPPEVIEKAIELLQIQSNDVVFDIGAGDGRFVLRCHESTGARCVGIEIDEVRADIAIANVQEKGFSSSLCSIIKGNALEQDYSSGTVFFLYLVPRGLKLILPILQRIPRPLRVITYMSPFPDIPYSQLVKIGTQKHGEAQWPVYLYELNCNPSPLDKSKKQTSLIIRPFQEEDAAEVTNIWIRGLQQTVDTSYWILQPIMYFALGNLGSKVTSTNGDFGPDGVNIHHHWMGEGRMMFVALSHPKLMNTTNDVSHQQQLFSSSTTSRVLGCCCVKRGADKVIVAPLECTEYSIHRLSVAEDSRGMGIGQQLMDECESWAKKQGGNLISLTIFYGNSIADEFYCKRGYTRDGYYGFYKSI